MQATGGRTAVRNCDFLVIGAGMAGASAAYELSAYGHAILLEREDAPGYHTTGRSAALYIETYGNETVRRLTKASQTFLDTPPAEFAERSLLGARGALYVARHDQLWALAQAYTEVRALTPSVRELTSAEAVAMVGVLNGSRVAGALYDPEAKDIDVHALHQGYLRGLRQRHGEIVADTEVTGISRTAKGWCAQSQRDTFVAPVMINAAGAWCDEIARLARVRPIGLIPKRRTVIMFDPPEDIDVREWPVVADIEDGFYFKPDAGRILASPGDETPMPPCDVQPDELDVAITVDQLERATTLQVRRIGRKWAGLRSFVKDKSPVVGMDDREHGFFWLAGQGGYGIQTAPAMARAVAALITTGTLPADLGALGLTPENLSPVRLGARIACSFG